MKKWFNKIKTNFKNATKGFSLVELIVVIAIMAVMAAVLAPALLGYVERSRAQKDDSAMGEVTNAIQLSLADQNVYDELLPYAVKGNFSCYADGDTSTNTDANKIITKSPDYWLFNDECRKLDETPYQPAGAMRGVTITLKPNGSAEYILKDGIINQTGDSSTAKGTITGKTLNDAPEVYNRLRSTVGDTIKVSSQTYRNSTYTIFISMGTTGGNQADKQDAIQVYGQYNGTNLPEVMTATGSATQDKGNASSGGGGALVTLPAKGKTLEEYTWAEVQQIVQAGAATEYGFAVGSTKTLDIHTQYWDDDIDEYQVTVDNRIATIIGLNHDGDNTATFMILSPSGIGQHGMYHDSIYGGEYNTGGWETSEMRAWLNSTVLNSMSNKDQIKVVNKMTNNKGWKGAVSDVTATTDSVFLLSAIEYGVNYNYTDKDVVNAEGSGYEWFNNNSIESCCMSRSPSAGKNNGYYVCDNGEVVGKVTASDCFVHPAFVIG